MSFEPKFGDSTVVNAQMMHTAKDQANATAASGEAALATGEAALATGERGHASSTSAKDQASASTRDIAPSYDNQSHHVERDMIMAQRNDEELQDNASPTPEELEQLREMEKFVDEKNESLGKALKETREKYVEVSNFYSELGVKNDRYLQQSGAAYDETRRALVNTAKLFREGSKGAVKGINLSDAKRVGPILERGITMFSKYLDERGNFRPCLEGTVDEVYDYLHDDEGFEEFKKEYNVPTKEAYNEKFEKARNIFLERLDDDATCTDIFNSKLQTASAEDETKFYAVGTFFKDTFTRILKEEHAGPTPFLGRTETEWKSNYSKLGLVERSNIKKFVDSLGEFHKETIYRWSQGKTDSSFMKLLKCPSIELLMLLDAINLGTVKSRSLYRLLGVNEATFPEELKIDQHSLDLLKVLRFIAFAVSLETETMEYYYSLIMPKSDEQLYVDVGITSKNLKERYSFNDKPKTKNKKAKENVMKSATEVSMIIDPSDVITAADLEKERLKTLKEKTDALTRNHANKMKQISELSKVEQEEIGYSAEEIVLGDYLTPDVLDASTAYVVSQLMLANQHRDTPKEVIEHAERIANVNKDKPFDKTLLVTVTPDFVIEYTSDSHKNYTEDFEQHAQQKYLLYKRFRCTNETIKAFGPFFEYIQDEHTGTAYERYTNLLSFIAYYGNSLQFTHRVVPTTTKVPVKDRKYV